MAALQGKRVFVAEDEPLIALMLEDMLTDMGCEPVGRVASVVKGIKHIEATDIDVAILDLNLNGESSMPIAEALAERKIPYIFATGEGARAGDYGDAPMIEKPYTIADVEQALAAALTR